LVTNHVIMKLLQINNIIYMYYVQSVSIHPADVTVRV